MDISKKRPIAALTAAVVALCMATLVVLPLTGPAQARAEHRDAGFFSGKLVNPANGKPVKGATVKVFRINTDHLLGSDTSGSEGRFRIDGLTDADEELDVRVNGSAVHFESGWVGCNHNVVPSWAAACSFGQGRQTPFHVQHL